MKIAVIGSRGFDDTLLLEQTLKDFPINELVSGGAKGADELAEKYADQQGIPKLIFLPEYGRYGRKAPLMRNYQIIDHAEEVIAFWDQKSSGTYHAMNYARKKGKKVTVVQF